MFLRPMPPTAAYLRFPRSRGDVPVFSPFFCHVSQFSPLTRGCSSIRATENSSWWVFPAHAGMFLFPMTPSNRSVRFPRSRGDVPCCARRLLCVWRFSPLTRGCSQALRKLVDRDQVFPAHAGMFLRAAAMKIGVSRFPRSRGDVPPQKHAPRVFGKFSPLTRGCSQNHRHRRSPRNVFPAHAGMFPTVRHSP